MSKPPSTPGQDLIGWLTALGLLAALLGYSFWQLNMEWNWAAVWNYRWKLLAGWVTTVLLASAALVLSVLLASLTVLASRSGVPAFKALARLYVELTRGTPLLVQILILFYVVADGFHLTNRHAVGVIALALFSGAYLAEIFRAAIGGVGASQLETARSLGLSPAQTYRLVILPQAARQALPPMAGQFASLIKDSSLLSVIGIGEFTLSAQEVNSYTFGTLETYLPLALGYWLLTLPLGLWIRSLEKRFRYET